MGRQLSSSEEYEIRKCIEEAGDDVEKLKAIREALEQMRDDDNNNDDDEPAVKKLVLKRTRW